MGWWADVSGRPLWPAVLASACIFLIVLLAPVKYTDSDSSGALLVTDALISKGSIKLDHYSDLDPASDFRYRQLLGHTYYYFPLGNSLAALPVVAVAKLFGVDVVDRNSAIQKLCAALTASLIFALLLAIGRLYVAAPQAMFYAILFWGGSALSSTLGTAYWSHNTAVLFILAALYMVLRKEGPMGLRYAALAGFCLFLAYLSRPTMALGVVATGLLVLLRSQRDFLLLAGITSAFLGVFVIFSLYEFGTLLPHYYMPGRLKGFELSLALPGHLISPSRGLFVYSPFLVLTLLAIPFARRTQPRLCYAICLLWFLLHWLSVSLFPDWTGGWSFGPRFMVDVLPGIYLLWLWTAQGLEGTAARRVTLLLFLCLPLGWAINVFQGLYNPATKLWNGVDRPFENVMNWRYAQFLHNQSRHQAFRAEQDALLLRQVSAGQGELGEKQVSIRRIGRPEERGVHRIYFNFNWSEGLIDRVTLKLPVASLPAVDVRFNNCPVKRVQPLANGRWQIDFDTLCNRRGSNFLQLPPAVNKQQLRNHRLILD
jgi:hypothetical protein